MLVLFVIILYLKSSPCVLAQSATTSPQTPPIYQIPLDTQQPLIARVGQPYSWTFLSGTFGSTSSLSYSLSGNPPWVSLHDRTLTGTPMAADVGQTSITITATDSTGSINTGTMQLVVSSIVAPTIEMPLATQLMNSTLGPSAVAPDGSLRVAVGQTFSFRFAAHSFDYPGQLYYSATVFGTASLPTWLSFDGNSLTFAGTPPNSLAPQTFTIDVDATDLQDFTGVNDYFNISVYQHTLSIAQPIPNQHVTQGNSLTIVIPPSTFAIDNVAVSAANRTTAIPKLQLSSTSGIMGPIPSWLTFDASSWTLQCTPDAHAGSMIIFIIATDAVGDQVVSNFTLTVNGHAPPGQLVIIPDEYINSQTVNMKLPLATSDPNSNSPLHYSAWFQPQNGSASWLQFNDSTNTVFGHTSSLAPQNITVLLTGYDKWNGSSSTCYHIFLQPASDNASNSNSDTRLLAIVLPTVMGFVLLIPLSIYLYCSWRRRRIERRQRFTGTSTIPPMAKPVAYNDPLPNKEVRSEQVQSDEQQLNEELRNSEPQEYASRRLSNSAFSARWDPDLFQNRTSTASALSDSTIQAPGTRPWSQVSTLRNSVRNISNGDVFSQMFAEEIRRSAIAKEAAWRQKQSLALDRTAESAAGAENRNKPWISGDHHHPRGLAHGGHTLTEGDISDLQIGEPHKAVANDEIPFGTSASSTNASYITARSSQDTLSSLPISGLNSPEMSDLEQAINYPYSSIDADFHSSSDTLPTVGKSHTNGSILSLLSRPLSSSPVDHYSTFPNNQTHVDQNETCLK